jgi:hypothetical protein
MHAGLPKVCIVHGAGRIVVVRVMNLIFALVEVVPLVWRGAKISFAAQWDLGTVRDDH